MSVISLLTDFGLDDNYVGVMKAVILNIDPKAKILDLAHNVERHNITEAAFLLKGSFKYFPKKTLFLVIVDPGVGSRRKAIIVKTEDYVFIGPDNGVLSLALNQVKIEKIIEITNKRYFLKPVSDTFHGRDIFSPVAGFLSGGIPIEEFGRKIEKLKSLNLPKVDIKDGLLRGEIIYVDHFGNLVTNIERDSFYDFINNRKFRIHFKKEVFERINKSYTQTDIGKPLVIWGSFGNLEISVNRTSAKDYFRVKKGEPVKIVRC